MPFVKVEEQVFSLLIFFIMADIVGTTVASRRWPAGGKPTVGRRRQGDGGPTSASNRNVPPASQPSTHWWWTAGGNLPFIATGGPTASCYLGCANFDTFIATHGQ